MDSPSTIAGVLIVIGIFVAYMVITTEYKSKPTESKSKPNPKPTESKSNPSTLLHRRYQILLKANKQRLERNQREFVEGKPMIGMIRRVLFAAQTLLLILLFLVLDHGPWQALGLLQTYQIN